MLELRELYAVQGFPDNYIIDKDIIWKQNHQERKNKAMW